MWLEMKSFTPLQNYYSIPLGIKKTFYNRLFQRINRDKYLYKSNKYEYQFKPYSPIKKSDMCLQDYLKSELHKNRIEAKKKRLKEKLNLF